MDVRSVVGKQAMALGALIHHGRNDNVRELMQLYEVCSKSKVTLYFYEKLFIYSSIFMLSPSK